MKDYINDVAKVEVKRIVTEKQCELLLKRGVLVNKSIVEVNGEEKYELTYIKYKFIDYEKLTVNLIRDRYTIDDELALNRKYNMYGASNEYTEYNNYVEECKVRAREFVTERVALLGK